MTNEKSQLSPSWEKARVLTPIAATVIIPLVIGLSTTWYGKAQNDKEIQLKYIELCIQILSTPPTDANMSVRKWAVSTLNQHSDVKIDSQTERELLLKQLARQMSETIKTSAERAIANVRP